MNFNIIPLSPDLINDFLWFFDSRAFCDNPEWAGCYCMFYQCKESLSDWEKRTGIQNREEAEQYIRDGRLKGYLAYHNNKPVGFCNVNQKRNLFFDKYRTEVSSTGNETIISVVCFVIDPDFRRKGMSKQFLSKIIDESSKNDFSGIIEAYPSGAGQEIKDNYHGYYGMYEKLGFNVVKEYDKFSVVQLKLH